jgi:hypothetical protein
MEMELVIIPLCTDDAGNETMTFAFQPVADAPSNVTGVN